MKKTVQGVFAPTPRVTKTAAFAAATLLSVPVFVLLTALDWLWL